MSLPKLVIADASCLINLERIGSLTLLKDVFGKVIITKEIATEFGNPLPDFVEVWEAPTDFTREIQDGGLDLGEASAISLGGIMVEEFMIIFDDRAARIEARKRGIPFTGLVGVLLRAKELGLVPNVKPYLEKLREVNFRMSKRLLRIALRQADES
jgi:predicted nucleic acid-binding protein